jgi:ubiquinone/menaquinone biosynthesis C-methylase UbiE
VTPDAANADQAGYWNGPAGHRWTALQESQDKLFAPITAALFEAAAPQPGEGVIDVGCGAGETTLRAAAATGRALGVDLSEPMLARARERASAGGSPARFAHADAATYDFSGEHADLMISRFGVMFFADPAATFANLRRGLRRGGRVAFLCWREPKLNPWNLLPYNAAVKHAPKLPKLGPDDPGPFSFSDEARVQRILSEAGFSGVELTPLDFTLDIGVGEGLDNAVAKSLEIGPASRALDGQPEAVRKAAEAEIRAALAERVEGGAIPLGAAVWIVRAAA